MLSYAMTLITCIIIVFYKQAFQNTKDKGTRRSGRGPGCFEASKKVPPKEHPTYLIVAEDQFGLVP